VLLAAVVCRARHSRTLAPPPVGLDQPAPAALRRAHANAQLLLGRKRRWAAGHEAGADWRPRAAGAALRAVGSVGRRRAPGLALLRASALGHRVRSLGMRGGAERKVVPSRRLSAGSAPRGHSDVLPADAVDDQTKLHLGATIGAAGLRIGARRGA